jgi:hypothetical protein
MNFILLSQKIIVVVILSCMTLSGFAQISYGIKGGSNITTIKDANGLGTWKTSFYAGLCANLMIRKKFFVDAELYYSGKGSKITIVPNGGTFNMNYLSAPLLVGFQCFKNLSILCGLEFSYLLRENATHIGANTGNYERFDLGLDGGLSYKAGKRWSIDLRYVYGLSPLLPPAGIYTSNGVPTIYHIYGYDRYRNRDFQMGVSYRISGK